MRSLTPAELLERICETVPELTAHLGARRWARLSGRRYRLVGRLGKGALDGGDGEVTSMPLNATAF